MSILSKLLSATVVLGVLAMFGMKVIHNHRTPDVYGLSGVVEYMMTTSPNRQVSKGSGVFISPTKVLTAAHVLSFGMGDERFHLRVRLQDGDLYKVKKIVKSKYYDLATLELERPYREAVKFPKFDCAPTVQGQVLNAIGSPLALEYIDVEIRATGGNRMAIYDQQANETYNGPSVPLPSFIETPSKPEAEKPEKTDENDPKKKKKYKVVPPNELPKGDSNNPLVKPKEEEPNINGGVYFQGPVLPGQSGSPVYDAKRDIRGVIVIALVDGNIRSYSGIGMYIDSPAVCQFVQGRE